MKVPPRRQNPISPDGCGTLIGGIGCRCACAEVQCSTVIIRVEVALERRRSEHKNLQLISGIEAPLKKSQPKPLTPRKYGILSWHTDPNTLLNTLPRIPCPYLLWSLLPRTHSPSSLNPLPSEPSPAHLGRSDPAPLRFDPFPADQTLPLPSSPALAPHHARRTRPSLPPGPTLLHSGPLPSHSGPAPSSADQLLLRGA